MKSLEIKFSNHYPKLYDQTACRLLAVYEKTLNQLGEEFLEYDTRYFVQGTKMNYQICPGNVLVLVFIGNKLIPFTTVRPAWPPEKVTHYKSHIGRIFNIHYGK